MFTTNATARDGIQVIQPTLSHHAISLRFIILPRQLSEYSSQVTGQSTGVLIPGGSFLLTMAFRPGLKLSQIYYNVNRWCLLQKQSGHHSPPHSTKVQNEWKYTSQPHTSSQCDVSLLTEKIVVILSSQLGLRLPNNLFPLWFPNGNSMQV